MLCPSNSHPEPEGTGSDPAWEEIASLLETVAALPDGEQRDYVLAHGSSEWVRSEVLELLAAGAMDGGFLEEGVRFRVMGEPLLERAGNCVLRRVAGRGGMGTVYEGLRTLELGDGGTAEQRVAVKVWHPGTVRPQEAVREARLLARLDHPCIARLLDTGQLPDGRPFLVMEFVEGKPLLEGAAGMGLREKVVLFRQICDAVESAHRALVVHRDLKPSNVLLTAAGEPKLIDFGIGKSMTDASQTVEVRLTLRYASPEQIRGEPLDTATDVYSLGVILYELVSGVHPFSGADGADPVALPRCPAELASVILKAMAPRAGERYRSVQGLSDDLERYLNGEPVRAVEATLRYRARKFVWRHRWAVGAGLTALALILFGFWRAYTEKQVAERRFDEVRGLARTMLYEIHDEVAKTPGTLESRRLIVSRALEYLDRLAADSQLNEALQMDLAESYTRVGEVQASATIMAESFGQPRDAARSYAKSAAIWERLYGANPKDRRRRVELARVADKLAMACAASNDVTCERAWTGRSEGLFAEDAAENPEDRRAQMRWLMSRIDARPVRGERPELEETRKVYRESAAGFDRLVARYPDDRQVPPYAAYVYKRVGALEGKLGAHAEGLAQYGKALRLHEREGNLSGVSTCYVDMAWIEQERKNWPAALEALDRALVLRRGLAEGRGADRNFRQALLSVMARRAGLLEEAGRNAEAEAAAAEALREPGMQITGPVQERRMADLLIALRRIRGDGFARRGEKGAAAREYGECLRMMELLEKGGHRVEEEVQERVRRGMGR